MSSFKINKVNPFCALRYQFIFLSNLFVAFEVRLLTNPGKLSLAKEVAIFISTFFPKSLNPEATVTQDWIDLNISALLSLVLLFIIAILLENAFLILLVCLVVRNN